MLRTPIQMLSIAFFCSVGVLAGENTAPHKTELKATQLRMQARIAAEQGDFTTAVQNILDASELTGDRATSERARKALPAPATAGGSPFANFGEILTLIQEQTSPPAKWLQVDGEGGTISISAQGVFVAAPEVLRAMSKITDDSHLKMAAEFARQANHNKDVRQNSELRMVSVPRLEKYVQQLITAGKPIPEDVARIAGLTRIDYLLVYPETGDIVIAGPAGEWVNDAEGRSINTESGRPTLNLDDLVTMTRTFGAGGTDFFMCTIDPRQQQVAAVQEFVRKERRSLKANTAAKFTQELEQRLGLQNVFVQGIPQDSRVASVIVDSTLR